MATTFLLDEFTGAGTLVGRNADVGGAWNLFYVTPGYGGSLANFTVGSGALQLTAVGAPNYYIGPADAVPAVGGACSVEFTLKAANINHGGNFAGLAIIVVDGLTNEYGYKFGMGCAFGDPITMNHAYISPTEGFANSGPVNTGVAYGVDFTLRMDISSDRKVCEAYLNGVLHNTFSMVDPMPEFGMVALLWSDSFFDRLTVNRVFGESAAPALFWTDFVKSIETP